MDLAKHLSEFAKSVPQRLPHIQGEESTKQALILPFLAHLGYDVYNPAEVKAEYAADFATKKRGQFEKVDYALCIDGDVSILIEAKAHNQKTEVHSGQLGRYFNATPTAKVAVVTNGIEYRFFTDLNEKNIMDPEPFLVFNVLNFTENEVALLSHFSRQNFNAENIGVLAEEVMCLHNITAYIYNQLQNPSEAFVRLIVEDLNFRQRITRNVIDRYTPVVRTAIRNALAELQNNGTIPAPAETKPAPVNPKPAPRKSRGENPSQELPPISEEETAVVGTIREVLACDLNYMKDGEFIVVPNVAGSNWALRISTFATKPHVVFNLDVDRARALAGHVFFFPHAMGTKANFTSLHDLYHMQEVIKEAFQRI